LHLQRPVPAAKPAVADAASIEIAHDLVHVRRDDLGVRDARRVKADARFRSQAGIGQRRQDRAGRPAIPPDPHGLARPGQPFAQLHHLQHIAAAMIFHVDEAPAFDDIGVARGGNHARQGGSKGQDQAKSGHAVYLADWRSFGKSRSGDVKRAASPFPARPNHLSAADAHEPARPAPRPGPRPHSR
jgi:hypothetical protein